MKLYTGKVVADWLALTERRVRQLRDDGVISERSPGLYELKAKWNGPSRTTLNPSQEVEAAMKRVEASFSTAQDEAAQLTGTNYRKNMRQRVEEERLKRAVDEIKIKGAQQPPEPPEQADSG